jgi:hypothetical protein
MTQTEPPVTRGILLQKGSTRAEYSKLFLPRTKILGLFIRQPDRKKVVSEGNLVINGFQLLLFITLKNIALNLIQPNTWNKVSFVYTVG